MRPRAKRTLVLAATAALAAGVGLGFAFTPADSDGDVEHDSPPPFTMDTDVEVMLLRIGMTPEVLATAGLPSATVQSALAAEELDLEAAVITLATHDAACSAAKKDTDALSRVVQSGLATPEEISDLATAKTTLATAVSARTTLLDGVLAGLGEHISVAAGASIQAMIDAKRWKTLPAAYRVEARTDAEWLQIRDALASNRTHERFGDGVPAEVTQFLATLDADADVAAATSNFDSNLAGVQALWDGVFVD